MKILCVFGKYNYGKEERGISYEYANFLPALKKLDHEIVFFESWNKLSYKNFSELNKDFLSTIEQEKPDIVFCVTMGCEIWVDSLELVRTGSYALLIHWATDDSWKYEQATRLIAPFYDVCTTTYTSAVNKSIKDGFNHFILTQWAANSATMLPPLPSSDCKYQVSFVGTAYGNRVKWIKKLQNKGIDVSCFGYGWPNGPVTANDIPRIIRESKISLNFGDSGIVIKNFSPVRSRQIKARIFEVPGAGGFLLTENADELEKFYDLDSEIVIFNNLEDLSSKIEYFLTHNKERDNIALAGYDRTQKHHTYEHRFESIIKYSLKKNNSRKSSEQSINFQEFAILEKQHQINTSLKLFKFLINTPCILFFGEVRGPRAARRIVYELSWRIFGVKIYSSSGWPGRLYYNAS
jgi:spore maturation protein CgeB